MTNFSPFFAGSGGLVTSVGFELSFSAAFSAAHRLPEFRKRIEETVRRMRIIFW
jgi:hypothetical protein